MSFGMVSAEKLFCHKYPFFIASQHFISGKTDDVSGNLFKYSFVTNQ